MQTEEAQIEGFTRTLHSKGYTRRSEVCAYFWMVGRNTVRGIGTPMHTYAWILLNCRSRKELPRPHRITHATQSASARDASHIPSGHGPQSYTGGRPDESHRTILVFTTELEVKTSLRSHCLLMYNLLVRMKHRKSTTAR